MMAFGLTQRDGSGLTVAGSIVTMVGLVLLYQNATGNWKGWAYAWALVGPGGSGLGMLLYGTRSGNRKMARDGFWQILDRDRPVRGRLRLLRGDHRHQRPSCLPLPEWVLPVAVIAIGLLVLFAVHRPRSPRRRVAITRLAALPPVSPRRSQVNADTVRRLTPLRAGQPLLGLH